MNSNNKQALSALGILRAVALITATTLALLFASCKQRGGGNNPIPTPKHDITFSVEGTQPNSTANGTLKATAEGIDETDTSPINVKEGKTVTLTATPEAGYVVKEWKVGGVVVKDNKTNTYTHTVATTAVIVTVSFESDGTLPNVPSVEGVAVLSLSPNKLSIYVKAKTVDDSPITIEGCEETTLVSNKGTTLTAKTTTVTLKGKIVELDCSWNNLVALNVQGLPALQKLSCGINKLTELNVQGLSNLQKLSCGDNPLNTLNVQGLNALQELDCVGGQLTSLNVKDCTALKELNCYQNKLNAEKMTELLQALPTRADGEGAKATLYTERTDLTEGNHKDFNNPDTLKTALDNAKSVKHWKIQKKDSTGNDADI